MQYHHLALTVPDLRAAEAFFSQVFDLPRKFLEGRGPDGEWGSLPPGKDWDGAAAAGITVKMAALGRNDFVLALFQGEPSQGTIVEIGIAVPPEEVDAIRRRLPPNTQVSSEGQGDLLFTDPYGFTWHIEPSGTPFVTMAETDGSWFDL